jgi:hypothetical protein
MKVSEKEENDAPSTDKDFAAVMKALLEVPHSKDKPKRKILKKKN